MGIAGLKELYDRFAGPADFVVHTAAVIEDDAHRNRTVFRGKGDDFLLDNHSRYSESDLKRLVREADTQFYAMGIFDPLEYVAERPRSSTGRPSSLRLRR